MMPEIDIVIPVQGDSKQLQKTVELLEANTSGYRLHVVIEPSLNVSEARQKAMNEIVKGDNVCFLDDDTELMHPHWLEAMYSVLRDAPKAGAVYAGEWWGNDAKPTITADLGVIPSCGINPHQEVEFGPAACMMIDRRRIPAGVRWDNHIGLRNGWIGGDFEEVDYAMALRFHGLSLYRATNTLFHHTGGRSTVEAFSKTDRCRAISIIKGLLFYKYAKAPEDGDWFKGLRYVKADDLMLAPGGSLRDCYRDVILRNGLGHVPMFRKAGLV